MCEQLFIYKNNFISSKMAESSHEKIRKFFEIFIILSKSYGKTKKSIATHFVSS